MKSEYATEVWAWFLPRAKIHDGYGWQDVSEKIARHLSECGIDLEESGLPDFGTVSEFADTLSPNNDLAAIVVNRWQCNCGDYSTGYSCSPNKWPSSCDLAIPGPYTLERILSEILGGEAS